MGRRTVTSTKNVINFDRLEIQLNKCNPRAVCAVSCLWCSAHENSAHVYTSYSSTHTNRRLPIINFLFPSNTVPSQSPCGRVFYQLFSAIFFLFYIPMSFSSSTFLGRRNLLSFRKICMDAWSWLLLKAHTRSDVNWTFITKRWSNADPHLEQSILSPPLPPHTNHTSSTLATILHNYVFLPPFIFIDGVCSRIF